ncbi:hypothetical protein [Mesorhizobium sp. WSM3860]|uniref:hypothetical protein n=1 Tax=Mesorhizobium sp. WSM3860 TaxID=2029403 RepID=UPI000BAF8578|nr:hypothetical protein [Mesorhizobium sp. WSM3860]PBC05728.1 hypothetical protein CK220_00600 [Mesorhizobium sp. WSM3860]
MKQLVGFAENYSLEGLRNAAMRDIEASVARLRRFGSSSEEDTELSSLFLAMEWIAATETKFEAIDHLLTASGWARQNDQDLSKQFLEYSAFSTMLRSEPILWSELPQKNPLSQGFLKAKSDTERQFTSNQYTGQIGENFYFSRRGKNAVRLWGCLESNALSFKLSLQAVLDAASGGQVIDFCRTDRMARQFVDAKQGPNRWRFLRSIDPIWSVDAYRHYGGRSSFDLWFSAMEFGENSREASKWKIPEIFISISRDDSNP